MSIKHMSVKAMVFVLAFLSLVSCRRSGEFMILVKNHSPHAAIIIAPDAGEPLKNAAQIMQHYIRESTGATLPVSNSTIENVVNIHIGMTSYVKEQQIEPGHLDEDGFLLKGIDNDNFMILGGSDWGTEFGVYDFLERFAGIRWLMATDVGIEIPVHDNLVIPKTEVKEEPVYLSRSLSMPGSWSQWGRFNRCRSRIAFGENLNHLFPPEKFGQTNPEFYPLINGKRYIPKNNHDTRTWQPNFSATGIADTAAKEIIHYFEKHPGVYTYSLGINDTQGKYDESPASRARRNGTKNYLGLENVSDDYFKWANEVAAKVHEVYPNALLGCLAYNNLADPPSGVNVDAHIVPLITYERMRWANPGLRKKGEVLTLAWSKVAPVLGWYDYAWGLNYMTPRVWFHEMQRYLSWGAKNHVSHYYAELYPNIGEGPKGWVLAKLLWNPDQDVDSLLDDWYIAAAGRKAASKLKAYYAIWEKFWTEDIYGSKWNIMEDQYLPFTVGSYALSIPDAYLTQADSLMKEALQLAETPLQKARVRKLDDMWQLYKTAITAYQSFPLPLAALGEKELKNMGDFSKELDEMTASPEVNDLWDRFEKLRQDPLYAITVDYMIRRTTLFNWIEKYKKNK